MATCQQHPLTLHVATGPNLAAQLKLALVKVALVLVTGHFTSQPKWQAGLSLALCAWALWISVRQVRPCQRALNSLALTVCLPARLHGRLLVAAARVP